jgi:hypothetical protein
MATKMPREDVAAAGLMKGGSRMFNVGARIGAGLVCAAIFALLAGGSGLAQEKFTPPQGKTITVDKSKPKEVEVPLEIAREAVRVGYYSAHAQLCNLLEEQQANYQTLMARQRDAKWTDQQMLYIQKLHQATVMIMTGKITFVESEGNLKPIQRPAKTNPDEPCTDAKRQNVKAQIASYINASPKAKTAEPAKAATQKK